MDTSRCPVLASPGVSGAGHWEGEGSWKGDTWAARWAGQVRESRLAPKSTSVTTTPPPRLTYGQKSGWLVGLAKL